jgi:hypothetical protein
MPVLTVVEHTHSNISVLCTADNIYTKNLCALIRPVVLYYITYKYREATLNSDGRKVIDFCKFNNLKIINTFFKHKEIHKFTWEARGHKSIIDYFITNMKTSKVIQDIRVYIIIYLSWRDRKSVV